MKKQRLMGFSTPNESITHSAFQDAKNCERRYKHLLTDEEKQWLDDFDQAYYRADKAALARLVDTRKRQLVTEIRQEAIHRRDVNKRQVVDNRQRALVSSYSDLDYTPAGTSPENALIDYIDATNKKNKV